MPETSPDPLLRTLRGDRLVPSHQLSLGTPGRAETCRSALPLPPRPSHPDLLPGSSLSCSDMGRLFIWKVRLLVAAVATSFSRKDGSVALWEARVPQRRGFPEEAWGRFSLGIRLLPRGQREQRRPCQAFRSRVPPPPLSVGSGLLLQQSQPTASGVLRAPESPNSSLSSQAAQLFPLETTARASGQSLLPSSAPTPRTPRGEAVRWVMRGACGRPKGAWGKAGSADVWAMGAGSLYSGLGLLVGGAAPESPQWKTRGHQALKRGQIAGVGGGVVRVKGVARFA